ncbi:unnamed protein product [Anisakis simplex]|uniref:Putative malate dehydrogenase (inferred by orthology to a S. mansoni protein) n=1 Tax=Anisakis simplex TaxID=6269 RepID=A0A0M3JQT9_ANISI|nr:unnamed protein product [Anisakis simplex]
MLVKTVIGRLLARSSHPASTLNALYKPCNPNLSALIFASSSTPLAGHHHYQQQSLRYFHTKNANPGEKIVEPKEAKRFMIDCMMKVGTVESHAEQLADVLVAADVRGHFSHGLNRLDMYIRDVKEKVCKGSGEPTILKERAASAWVDGNNLLGPVIGNFCMDLAIKKAKEAGVGWVVTRGSNHFGIAGWYSMRAMREGLMGLAFTNTSPIMYPTRASAPAIGTNPLTLAANGTKGDSFVLDMATTAVAVGKVEIASRRGEKVPESWGVARGGIPSIEPAEIITGGGLLPLGGHEINSGYKGYGLGALVEIFCGILGGSHWGPHIRKWMSTATDADLGQCFIAIDPEAFAPNFHERMQEFMDTMRNLKPIGDDPVLVAGDPEMRHTKFVEKCGGIPYHPNQIIFADEISQRLDIPKMRVKRTV